jgi:hypothetical protein
MPGVFTSGPAARLTTSNSTIADMLRVGWRLDGLAGCAAP